MLRKMYEEADFVIWSFNRRKSAIPYPVKKPAILRIFKTGSVKKENIRNNKLNCIDIILLLLLVFFQYHVVTLGIKYVGQQSVLTLMSTFTLLVTPSMLRWADVDCGWNSLQT